MSSASSVEQVTPYPHWPSGDSRALAVLPVSPDELSHRFGLEFYQAYDDLDWYRLAAIQLPSGVQVWLKHYRGEPAAETTVYADAAALSRALLEQLGQALHLSPKEFVWVSPLI